MYIDLPSCNFIEFIYFNRFLVESLGFSLYKIMSSAKRDNFTSSFPTWMPFISCSCLIALARTSSTMLNRSGKSRHPCLIPHLRGKVRVLKCPAGLYTPVTAASHPDALTSSRCLPGSSQCSHASLLASLLTHQALFSHSPLALAGHVMPPATAELTASLPAGV